MGKASKFHVVGDMGVAGAGADRACGVGAPLPGQVPKKTDPRLGTQHPQLAQRPTCCLRERRKPPSARHHTGPGVAWCPYLGHMVVSWAVLHSLLLAASVAQRETGVPGCCELRALTWQPRVLGIWKELKQYKELFVFIINVCKLYCF